MYISSNNNMKILTAWNIDRGATSKFVVHNSCSIVWCCSVIFCCKHSHVQFFLWCPVYLLYFHQSLHRPSNQTELDYNRLQILCYISAIIIISALFVLCSYKTLINSQTKMKCCQHQCDVILKPWHTVGQRNGNKDWIAIFPSSGLTAAD